MKYLNIIWEKYIFRAKTVHSPYACVEIYLLLRYLASEIIWIIFVFEWKSWKNGLEIIDILQLWSSFNIIFREKRIMLFIEKNWFCVISLEITILTKWRYWILQNLITLQHSIMTSDYLQFFNFEIRYCSLKLTLLNTTFLHRISLVYNTFANIDKIEWI